MTGAPPSDESVRRRRVAALALALIVVGIAARITSAAGGLWRDEALFLFVVASRSIGDMLGFLRNHESHPPLFYLLMRGWQWIAGRGEVAAMVLPIFLGVITIPVTYVVARRMVGARAAGLAAVLVALHPALIYFSAQVRPYSVLPLLTLLSTYTLWRGLTGEDGKWLTRFGLLSLLLLYTHNWSWLIIGSQSLVVGLAAWRDPAVRRRLRSTWMGWGLIPVAGYLPWLPTFLHQVRHAGHASVPVRSVSEPFEVLARTTLGAFGTPDKVVLAAVLVPAIWSLLGLVRDKRRGELPLLDRLAVGLLVFAPVAAVIVAAAYSSRSNLLIPRCVLSFAPGVIVAFAWGVTALPRDRAGTWITTGVTLALYMISIAGNLLVIKSNAREVARAVTERARPSDLVVITPEWLASSFNYYFRADNPQVTFPHIGRQEFTSFDNLMERLGDPKAVARALQVLDAAREAGKQVWFITAREEPEFEHLATEGSLKLLARTRSNELKQHLIAICGPPDTTSVPAPEQLGTEILLTDLFCGAGR